MGLHPSEILIGYEKGAKKALEILEDLPIQRLENIKDLNELKSAIKTSIASKQFGLEDFLGGLIANACLYAMPEDAAKFNVDNIRV
jgi:T-complex protein 1 subunit theta